jgi:SAM-dependent methyltransferase
MMSPSQVQPDYPLQRDEAEHERLDAQARFWSSEATALFASTGVAPGWHVADLGCGTLDVALQLARRVGPLGSVRALDNDGLLVRRMARLARAIRAADVRIVEADAYDTGWADGKLDAVHARFLAAPSGRLDDLVAEMHRVVRPGGVVMLQDPDSSTWAVPTSHGAWERLRALIREGFLRRGGNFDMGRELAAGLTCGGLVDVQCRRVVRTVDVGHVYASLPLAFARQLRPLWLAEGMIAAAELDPLLDEVAEGLAAGGTVTTFTLVQAWGRRPAD